MSYVSYTYCIYRCYMIKILLLTGEGQKRFAAFCLTKLGTEVQDTVLLDAVDPSMTDISFDDILILYVRVLVLVHSHYKAVVNC